MVNSCCPQYQCCRYLIVFIALIFGLISALKASLHSMSNFSNATGLAIAFSFSAVVIIQLQYSGILRKCWREASKYILQPYSLLRLLLIELSKIIFKYHFSNSVEGEWPATDNLMHVQRTGWSTTQIVDLLGPNVAKTPILYTSTSNYMLSHVWKLSTWPMQRKAIVLRDAIWWRVSVQLKLATKHSNILFVLLAARLAIFGFLEAISPRADRWLLRV